MTDKKKTERPLGEKIIRAITSGRCDPWIQGVLDAAVLRQRYLRQKEAFERLAQLKEGDTVQVIEGIKPRYFIGRKGKVLTLTNTRRRGFPMVEVDFGTPIRRYGAIVSMPASCLRVIPEQQKLKEV